MTRRLVALSEEEMERLKTAFDLIAGEFPSERSRAVADTCHDLADRYEEGLERDDVDALLGPWRNPLHHDAAIKLDAAFTDLERESS